MRESTGLREVKGGFFLFKDLEIEGNFGYLNHFELSDTDPESRGLIWEGMASYHLPMGTRVRPYISGGIGGITAVVDSENSAGSAFSDGDTFFTFSYGGGVKAHRLWGPVGLRGDARGRTIPNLHGDASSFLEVTGGLTFVWGE